MNEIIPCSMNMRSSTVPFHKHCQATVCSAYGPDGNGLTWNILDGLQLDSLDRIRPDWMELFKFNENNITEDMGTILTLIDTLCDEISKLGETSGWKITGTIRVKDLLDDDIGSFNFNDDNACEVRIGHQVNLLINNKPLSFHTLINRGGSGGLDLTLTPADIFGPEISNRQIVLKVNGRAWKFHPFWIESDDVHRITLEPSSEDYDINRYKLSNGNRANLLVGRNSHIYNMDLSSSASLQVEFTDKYWEYLCASNGSLFFEVRVHNTGHYQIEFRNPEFPYTVDQGDNISIIEPDATNSYWYHVYPTSDSFVMTRILSERY